MRLICLGTVALTSAPWITCAKAQDNPPLAAGNPPVAASAAVSPLPSDSVASWAPVSEQALDETRGGFDLGNGLIASFGIDRAVYVNGNLVTSISVNVPDIAHMTAVQASALASALNTVSVTQIGPNNTFDPSSLGSKVAAATVIQNTLNNQNIQSTTTLNTSVNTLNAFRQMNFQDALQAAQLQSLGH
ncbi:hypothetical protein [Dyella sp. ASV21]|uniref:hypothetical protein n=1 Tax=Dyella sp. ASV21 TaxID=2795114 RepID=UPI001E4F116F|nr:hypothetical protein [Dyella sp. ASV21]